MTDQTSQDEGKVDEYLNVIWKRILAPIEKTEVQEYCTATLLLLFAAIDGVGKLLHPKNDARPDKRILGFLDYMGDGYKVHKKQLLALRNSLAHNALNVACFLSNYEEDPDHQTFHQHLKEIGDPGFIYVNTVTMYKDFVNALQRFQTDIKDNPEMMKRAADRLEWREDIPLVRSDIPEPTHPSTVEFIYAR